MNNTLRDILLFIIVLVLSYFTGEYFGAIYNKFAPIHDHSLLGLSTGDLIHLIGAPFAYIFFTILLFKLFAGGNQNKWIGWFLVPPALFFASGDLKHIYLPIILGLVAYSLAMLITKVFKFA